MSRRKYRTEPVGDGTKGMRHKLKNTRREDEVEYREAEAVQFDGPITGTVANDLINDMREEWDMEFVEEPAAPVRTYEQGVMDERTAIVTCLETLVRLWGDRDIGVDEINLVERLAVQLQRGDHIPASGKKVGGVEE